MTATAKATTVREQRQRDALRAHLHNHLDTDRAAFLMWEIEHWIEDARPRAKGMRKPHMLDEAICLAQGRRDVHHLLTLLIARDRSTRRGPEAKTDRAELIHRLNDFYPAEIKRKTRGGPFEKTIEMVCDLTGYRSPSDVHELVIDTLAGADAPSSAPSIWFEAAWAAWQSERESRG